MNNSARRNFYGGFSADEFSAAISAIGGGWESRRHYDL